MRGALFSTSDRYLKKLMFCSLQERAKGVYPLANVYGMLAREVPAVAVWGSLFALLLLLSNFLLRQPFFSVSSRLSRGVMHRKKGQ